MGEYFIDAAKEEHFHPHEWRMILELRELQSKIDKLEDFTANNPLFNEQSEVDKNYMILQCGTMMQYAVILEMRIRTTANFIKHYSDFSF